MRAARALAMNVSDADAGPTTLTSAHESVTNKLKNARAMNSKPSRKRGLEATRRTTWLTPCEGRIAPRSPSCFIARDCKTSPAVAQATITPMPAQACALLNLAPASTIQCDRRAMAMPRRMRLRSVGRPARDNADPYGDQRNAQPVRRRDIFMQEDLAQRGHEDVAQGSRRQDIREIGPR